ncbi:Short transient receptor potential channel 7 [Holothuria leucospilota]|uniref:Short transient receptor potential channel 7 n=1 Tax=Holothuria leucospilota TaxID=206669 RepID=A0A9Q0YP49_HOLLE|nr:Short transient receptor potential channel 7 [Holothuria leucospilota]
MEMERLHSFQDSELLTKFDRAIRKNDLETLDLLCREGVEEADSANSEYGVNLYDKAIYYGNSDALKVLVDYEVPMFNDGFFHAVSARNPEMARIFAEHLSKTCENREISEFFPQSASYPPNVTPLMRASEQNDLKMTKILLENGHRLPSLENLLEKSGSDEYLRAYTKIRWYRARCSECMIVLTSDDPFAVSFELAQVLREEYIKFPELNEELDQIEEGLALLARNFLDCAQNKEEATILLEVGRQTRKGQKPKDVTCNHMRLSSAAPPHIHNGLRLQYKEFIATPYSQEYMLDRWYNPSRLWRVRTPAFLFYSLIVCLASPVICALLICLPIKDIRRAVKTPYTRFLFHLTSDIIFICLLVSTTLNIQLIVESNQPPSLQNLSKGEQYFLYKGLYMTVSNGFIMVWIIGIAYRNAQVLWRKGAIMYFKNFWWVIDYLQIIFYCAFMTLFIISNVQARIGANKFTVGGESTSELYTSLQTPTLAPPVSPDLSVAPGVSPADPFNVPGAPGPPGAPVAPGPPGPPRAPGPGMEGNEVLLQFDNQTRFNWDPYDPVFLCEATFAVANILSFIRMIQVCVIFKFLGPLQISLSGIIVQIIKFLVIFSFVWISFALGFSQLYRSFETLEKYKCTEDCREPAFISLHASMATLFWSLFDLLDLEIFEINTEKEFSLVQRLGFTLYAIYLIVAVIIMLNALIAMMSNHYTRIEENAEKEWRFARTKLMVDVMEYIPTVPPPLNLIPSVSTITKFGRLGISFLMGVCGKTKEKTRVTSCSCKEKYKKTVHNIRIRFIEERCIEIQEPEREEQHITRLEQKLDKLKLDLDQVVAHTERMMSRLHEMSLTHPDVSSKKGQK